MNIGLIQLRFDILTVIIVCFVIIEVCLIIYSIFFRRVEHSTATPSVSVILISCICAQAQPHECTYWISGLKNTICKVRCVCKAIGMKIKIFDIFEMPKIKYRAACTLHTQYMHKNALCHSNAREQKRYLVFAYAHALHKLFHLFIYPLFIIIMREILALSTLLFAFDLAYCCLFSFDCLCFWFALFSALRYNAKIQFNLDKWIYFVRAIFYRVK